MRGRQLLLLSTLLILTFSSTADATTDQSRATDKKHQSDHRLGDLDFSPTYDYYMPEMRWSDSVTMTRLPPGSLIVKYDGVQKLIVKHSRSQVRRFARKYRAYEADTSFNIDVWNDAPTLNAWWTRSWMDSLPSAKGGAPDSPYVHTIGQEITWSLGPLSITNTLKLKIDYLAVLKFNPDPGDKTGDSSPPPISIDVQTARGAVIGSSIKFKIRPSVKVGLPTDDGWFTALRSVALRAEFEITILGVHILKGDIVVKYKPDDGDNDLLVQIGLNIGRW